MPNLRDAQVAAFTKDVDRLLQHHAELKLAINNKRNEARLHSELVTQLSLSLCVLWQEHLHRVFIAYIVMSPRRSQQWVDTSMRQSIQDKFGRAALACVSFDYPRVFRGPDAERLVDPRGWNISPRSSTELAQRATELLTSRYARRFALGRDDSELFDFAVALRNFLSHRSSASASRLRAAATGLRQPVNAPLRATPGQIGPYLKAATLSGESRVEYFAARLKSLAAAI